MKEFYILVSSLDSDKEAKVEVEGKEIMYEMTHDHNNEFFIEAAKIFSFLRRNVGDNLANINITAWT